MEESCNHCNRESAAFKYTLESSNNFDIVADANPLVEGHLLIIPHKHISCVGALEKGLLLEFLDHYSKCKKFLRDAYSSSASFEHGVVGQTVFHSHVHLLPGVGLESSQIVPEGEQYLRKIQGWDAVLEEFQKEGKYLFFSIDDENWLVDTALGQPRFFRDRFAQALGVPERGNWKSVSVDPKLNQKSEELNIKTKRLWEEWQT